MYFLYLMTTGAISPPVIKGEPEDAAINKELVCSLGSGIKWENVDLFYAPDDEFPDDFKVTAPQGHYYIEDGEAKETPDWEPPEEPEWP